MPLVEARPTDCGPSNRFALVIGCSSYSYCTSRPRAKNDAEDMHKLLVAAGFASTLLIDATEEEMLEQRETLVRDLERAQSEGREPPLVVVFFAGMAGDHGHDDLTWLLSVDCPRGLAWDLLLSDLETSPLGNNTVVFLLDVLCPRGNAWGFPKLSSGGWTEPNTRFFIGSASMGLSYHEHEPNAPRRNGHFTQGLLKHLDSPPGRDLVLAFRDVGRDVERWTRNTPTLLVSALSPRCEHNLIEDLVLFPPRPCMHEGCGKLLTAGERSNHEARCEHRPLSCLIPKCGFKGNGTDLLDHLHRIHGYNAPAAAEQSTAPVGAGDKDEVDSLLCNRATRRALEYRATLQGRQASGSAVLLDRRFRLVPIEPSAPNTPPHTTAPTTAAGSPRSDHALVADAAGAEQAPLTLKQAADGPCVLWLVGCCPGTALAGCGFRHSRPLRRGASPNAYSKVCEFHSKGCCKNDVACQFAHGPEELRGFTPPPPTGPSPP